MKNFLRNFYTTLFRFKTASVLNLIGLSLSFSAFIIILIQASYDINFDRFHPKADQIYRLEVSPDGTQFNSMTGRKWAEFLEQRFPQVETTGLRMKYSGIGDYLKIDVNGELQGYNEVVELIHPDFVEVFDFAMVEGNRTALTEPGKVILPQSIAKRYWGDQSAMGKQLIFVDTVMTVGGVYRDFPRNTLVENVIYYGINPTVWSGFDGWQFNYEFFLTIPSSVDKADIENKILESIKNTTDVPDWIREHKKIRLNPVYDIYYTTDTRFDSNPKGSAAASIILLSIAVLIVVIASINFINFSTSLTPLRIKSINLHKVFGSRTGALRWMMIFEAVGISLIAFLLALCIVSISSSTAVAGMLNADISIGKNLGTVGLSLIIALMVGALAGIYPAFYSTKFPPALVLKGSFGLSSRGRMLRTVLICFQYVISIILIIGALFMQLQSSFFMKVDKGYNTNSVLIARLNDDINQENQKLFMNELKKNPQFENVAFSQFQFGTGDSQRQGLKINDKNVNFAYIVVSEEFLDVMDIKVTGGRNFESTDQGQTLRPLIVNDAFIRAAETEVGHVSDYFTITGVVGNINFRPLQVISDEPLAFSIASASMPWAYFKINGDPYAAIEHIKKSVAQIDPAFPVDVMFYDQVYDQIYQNERKTTSLITLFSLLAIVISLVGVFGLVIFETQYRRKEIGLRKIHGATTGSILAMFNSKFVWMVAACFVIAAPLAWYGVKEWLAEFAYRTPLYWWVFVLSLSIVLLITVLTVTIQSWRAATTNPIKSLKSE